MAEFGSEYSSDSAYFIAGGRTLQAIKQYESDRTNAKALLEAIGKEYGATSIFGYGSGAHMYFSRPVNNPALKLEREDGSKDKEYCYQVDYNTPEGKALLERIGDIPQMDMTQTTFAKRLTGAETIKTNPDDLRESNGYSGSPFRVGNSRTAATYTKYGDTYVVSVPRVIRGIFNAASAKASEDDHYTQAAGYTYENWTPPDSVQIPYSKTIELREQQLGDQLTPVTVMKKVAAFPDRR